MIGINAIADYRAGLARSIDQVEIADLDGKPMSIETAFYLFIEDAKNTHGCGGKIIFVGNGGSAAIASHMAIDYSKNGKLRSIAFNDASSLTCLSNDLGYEEVFAKQVEMYADDDDMLIAISSSGQSANILRAVSAARGMKIVTFSGFTPTNPLRIMGDLNFYVNSTNYGFVEVAHLSILHMMLDLHMGWKS